MSGEDIFAYADDSMQEAKDYAEEYTYSKEEELSAALKTALGLATTATPTQAMEKLRQLVNTAQNIANIKGRIAFGSYAGRFSGTQTGGPSKAVSLYLQFTPAVVIMIGVRGSNSKYSFLVRAKANWIMDTRLLSGDYVSGVGFGYDSSTTYGAISGNTISWYTLTENGMLQPGYQFDDSGNTYYYVAIG